MTRGPLKSLKIREYLEEALSQVVSRRITLEDQQECVQLFGEKDKNLNLLRDSFPVTLVARGNEIILSGEPLAVSHVTQVIESLTGSVEERWSRRGLPFGWGRSKANRRDQGGHGVPLEL